MKKLFRVRFGDSQSDNLKSKIQNRKSAGLFSIIVALAFAFGGVEAQAQQPGKIFRIGFRITALLPVWQCSWTRCGGS